MSYRRTSRRSNSMHVIDFMEWISGDMPWQAKHRMRTSTAGSVRKRNIPTSSYRRDKFDRENRPAGFTAEQVEEFRQIFEFYDVDNNKIMDMRSDLEVALRALGFSPSADEVNEVISLMDVDGDKTIDFSEFCMIIEYLQFKKGKYGDLSEAFRCLDLSNEGLALEDDVTKMLSSHAQEMSLKEINDLIRFAKSDEPDTIDYTKFVDAVKRSDCSSSNENENHEEDGLKFFETVKNSFANLKAKSADNNSSTSGSLDFDKSRSTKRRRNTETIDTLVRALGGPILITSAVIITANTHKKGKRWPSIQKVLRLQT